MLHPFCWLHLASPRDPPIVPARRWRLESFSNFSQGHLSFHRCLKLQHKLQHKLPAATPHSRARACSSCHRIQHLLIYSNLFIPTLTFLPRSVLQRGRSEVHSAKYSAAPGDTSSSEILFSSFAAQSAAQAVFKTQLVRCFQCQASSSSSFNLMKSF